MMIFLIIAALFVAFSNGANDNFKGVATLFGSRTTSYRPALFWATVTTLAGSLASVYWAQGLVAAFSGKGLVPDALAGSPEFLLAVAGGAGLTVMLATVMGFPVSTTHGLVGALLGAGLVAIGSDVNAGVLGRVFVLPLLFGPIAAVFLAAASYRWFRYFRLRLGITKVSRVGLERTSVAAPLARAPLVQGASMFSLGAETAPHAGVRLAVDSGERGERYAGTIFGIGAQRILDVAHYLSAGLVGFARGMNDTPKIVALLLAVEALSLHNGSLLVALAIALGGLLQAGRVARTLSHKITQMNDGQGFTANLITALLVGAASRFGLPVSTTHVAVGSLFGIGLVTRQAKRNVVSGIVMSWVLTLPVAAILGGTLFWLSATWTH